MITGVALSGPCRSSEPVLTHTASRREEAQHTATQAGIAMYVEELGTARA